MHTYCLSRHGWTRPAKSGITHTESLCLAILSIAKNIVIISTARGGSAHAANAWSKMPRIAHIAADTLAGPSGALLGPLANY